MPVCNVKKSSGVALVSVLWVITLLSVLAMSISASVRSSTSAAHNLLDDARASGLAEGGVHLAAYHLLQTDPQGRWPADGTRNRIDMTDTDSISVAIQDEAGKININLAEGQLIRNLLVAVGVEVERVDHIVDAILDWRDGDSLRRLNGAERQEYEMAGLDYAPANKPFESVDELRLVLGMTGALFDQISPSLTVYSKHGGVNPLYASRDVLLAVMGNNSESVDQYIRLRESGAAVGMPAIPPEMKPYVTPAGGEIFSVASEGRVGGHAFRIDTKLMIKRASADQPFELIDWSDNRDVSLLASATTGETENRPGH